MVLIFSDALPAIINFIQRVTDRGFGVSVDDGCEPFPLLQIATCYWGFFGKNCNAGYVGGVQRTKNLDATPSNKWAFRYSLIWKTSSCLSRIVIVDMFNYFNMALLIFRSDSKNLINYFRKKISRHSFCSVVKYCI